MNQKKAGLLYDCIDKSNGFYKCPVVKEDRSLMNVPYRLQSETLEEKFLEEAKKYDLIGLKGHRSVGGIRASIYNALPYQSVETLVSCMDELPQEEFLSFH